MPLRDVTLPRTVGMVHLCLYEAGVSSLKIINIIKLISYEFNLWIVYMNLNLYQSSITLTFKCTNRNTMERLG